jgi:TPR repeat protein
MYVGTEKFQDKGSSWSGVYEAWDCGTVPTPEQLEQLKDEEAKKQVLIEKQKAEAQKTAQAKVYATQAKAIIWLQSQATNGSVSAQCSLGLHYLNGQGCETNKELAVYWLTQAANQGDFEASNTLAKLK